MEKYFDFIIQEDKYRKVKLRFYPKESRVISYKDTIPKTLQEAEAFYYSWGIFQSKNLQKPEKDSWTPYNEMFRVRCDEHSVLEYLGTIINSVIINRENEKITNEGRADWEIKYIKSEKSKEFDCLEYYIWDNWNDKGYRFKLSIRESKNFISFLRKVNNSMIAL